MHSIAIVAYDECESIVYRVEKQSKNERYFPSMVLPYRVIRESPDRQDTLFQVRRVFSFPQCIGILSPVLTIYSVATHGITSLLQLSY